MKNTLFTLAVTALFCVACGSGEVQDAGSASVQEERLEALNAKFPIKDDLGPVETRVLAYICLCSPTD